MFSSRILKTGLLVLALSGSATLPAQAGESTGTWRNGMVDGAYGPGWYGPGGAYYEDTRTVRRRTHVRERHRTRPSHRAYRYAPNRYYGDSYYPRRGYDWPVERPRPGRMDRAIEEGRR